MGSHGLRGDTGITITNFPIGEVRRKPASGYIPNRKSRNEAYL